jgi:hypothetical protein
MHDYVRFLSCLEVIIDSLLLLFALFNNRYMIAICVCRGRLGNRHCIIAWGRL